MSEGECISFHFTTIFSAGFSTTNCEDEHEYTSLNSFIAQIFLYSKQHVKCILFFRLVTQFSRIVGHKLDVLVDKVINQKTQSNLNM